MRLLFPVPCQWEPATWFREASFVYWSLYSRGMAATRAQSVPAFEIIESVSPLSILYIRVDVNRELASCHFRCSFPRCLSTGKHFLLDHLIMCACVIMAVSGPYGRVQACVSGSCVCVHACVQHVYVCVCVFSCVYVRHVYVCFHACMSSTCICVYGCVRVHARVSGTCVLTCMYILSRQPLQSLNNSPNGTHVTLRHCEASSLPVL